MLILYLIITFQLKTIFHKYALKKLLKHYTYEIGRAHV